MPIPNTTDCPPKALGEVDFQSYCNMMEPLGLTRICRNIQGTMPESQQVKRGLCQDNFGDGTAEYAQYGKRFGENRIIHWQNVSYWKQLDGNALSVFEDAIFLAGAFSLLQIPSIPTGYDTTKHLGTFREDLPVRLIEDTDTLRVRCLGSGAMICLKDGSVQPLVTALNKATEHLKPKENEDCITTKVRRFTGRLNQLKENNSLFEGRIKDRAKLTAAVAAYNKTSSGESSSPEFLKNEIGRYRQMVKLAIMQYHLERNIEMPSATTERLGVPTAFKPEPKSNPFGSGDLDDDVCDDSVKDNIPKKSGIPSEAQKPNSPQEINPFGYTKLNYDSGESQAHKPTQPNPWVINLITANKYCNDLNGAQLMYCQALAEHCTWQAEHGAGSFRLFTPNRKPLNFQNLEMCVGTAPRIARIFGTDPYTPYINYKDQHGD